MRGLLKLDLMISGRVRLDQINEARRLEGWHEHHPCFPPFETHPAGAPQSL